MKINSIISLFTLFSGEPEAKSYIPLINSAITEVKNGLATLFWTKLLRTRNYFNYSSYPADFRVFNPLYSTGVR